MMFNEWKPIYQEILKDFNFSKKNDETSAEILDKIIQKKHNSNLLKNLIYNKEIVVFGAGTKLEKTIKEKKVFLKGKTLISADGATTALLKNDIIPHIILTDLDGKINDLLIANAKNSIVLIHAHGDNIEKIKKYVSRFKGIIFGTTQTDPILFKNLFNFGGFTDGDRCIFLSEHFNARKIFLIGFNFDGDIGIYSFTGDKELKIRKLKWCKKLIDFLNNKNKNIEFI